MTAILGLCSLSQGLLSTITLFSRMTLLARNGFMAKLIFIDKNFAGRVYPLVLEKTTVGRSEQNTLAIHDNSLSSVHCEILMNGTEVIVRDLDSSNGTFIEGVRLNKQAQLKSGQTVRFGAVQARLLLEGEGEDDETDITAVYTMGRVMREQRRAQNKPDAEAASIQISPDDEPAPQEHTILIPKSNLPKPAKPAEQSEAAETDLPQDGHNRKKLVLLIGFLVLGLVIVLWSILRRR